MAVTTPERSTAPPSRAREADAGPVLRLARWSARHKWKALALWLVFVVGAVVGGQAVGTRLLTDSEEGVGESGRADRVVAQAGYPVTPDERVLVQERSGPLDRATGRAVTAELRARFERLPEVGSVAEAVVSRDGTAWLLPLSLDVGSATGDEADAVAVDGVPTVLAVTRAVANDHPDLRIQQVGDASIDAAIDEQISADFQRAELLSLPVTLVILLLTFGSLLAAGVPLLLALSAVAAAIGLSAFVSQVVPTMDALSSVILLIGMAVGVDYSLFYVRRAREERGQGAERHDAIELAARTSGRAVLVSGVAVFVAMSGLLLSGDATFVSMAVGTMLVVAVAVLGSLTVLPAVLSILGDKVDRPRVPLVHRLRRQDGVGRFWPAIMRVVLAKPLVSLLLAGAAMVGLALPALGMKTGEAGADSLPRSIPIMRAYDSMTAAFPQTGFAHEVVVWSETSRPLDRVALDAAVKELKRDAGSGRFAELSDVRASLAPDGRTAVIDVPMVGDFNTDRSKASLSELRDHLVPVMHESLPGTEIAVTGPTAYAVDFGRSMAAHLPWVMGFVLTLTFVVLVLAFRSVVVAATAVVLNLLSVAAAYGLLVLVFQHGWGEELLDFRSNGTVIDWLPLFLFVVLFGLSMDYHVFVVSRIREAHEAGLPTRAAVTHGVTASAGVVTSAAMVMVGVFSIFGTLSLLEFKQLGVGLAAAVLIDATIVRAVLLPSTMTLLGRRNWWLPPVLEPRLASTASPSD